MKKKKKKICRPLAGPDPPLPPAIFSENRGIIFFPLYTSPSIFTFFTFFIPLPFHIFTFDPISKEQLNLNPESLFTEQQKSTAWTLVFPGWRPAWSTWVATRDQGGDHGSAATREQLTSVFTLDAHSLSSVCGPSEKIWLCWSAQ